MIEYIKNIIKEWVKYILEYDYNYEDGDFGIKNNVLNLEDIFFTYKNMRFEGLER